MRPAIIGGSLVTLGVAFGYVATIFLSPRATPEPRTRMAKETLVTKPAEQTGALQSRLTFLESELLAMRARLEDMGKTGTPAAEAHEAPAAEAAPPVSPEEIAQQKAVWHEHMLEVAAEYESEARDPRWARDAQTTITLALDGLPALSKGLRSLDCRSETCRVEVVNDHQPDFDKQLALLPLGLRGLPSAEFDQLHEPDGKVRTVVYFTRQTDTPTAGG